MLSRVKLEIKTQALQKLLSMQLLDVADFSCTDTEAKQELLKIYRQLTAEKIRSSNLA